MKVLFTYNKVHGVPATAKAAFQFLLHPCVKLFISVVLGGVRCAF